MPNNYTLLKGLKNLHHHQPDATWSKTNKQVLLSYFNNNFSSTPNQLFGFSLRLRPVVATFVILGVMLTGGVGTLYAAKNTIPGQHLYAVKRFAEKVRLAVTTDAAQKNVLRAELLNNRVTEALVLARRVNDQGDPKAGKNLIVAVYNIKSEIGVLQKEISDQVKSNTADNADSLASAISTVADNDGTLPIEDGKKVADMVLSPDVQKSLLETQELLIKKNLTSALVKTVEVSAKLDFGPSVTSTTATTTSTTSIINNTTSTNSIIKKSDNSTNKDFVAPIIEDEPDNADLLNTKKQ